jgi:hypothetical protein
VKRSDRGGAIAGHHLGEASTELDELIGDDHLRIERTEVGAVADELRMDGGECERGQLEELLERDEDRELGSGDKLVGCG